MEQFAWLRRFMTEAKDTEIISFFDHIFEILIQISEVLEAVWQQKGVLFKHKRQTHMTNTCNVSTVMFFLIQVNNQRGSSTSSSYLCEQHF